MFCCFTVDCNFQDGNIKNLLYKTHRTKICHGDISMNGCLMSNIIKMWGGPLEFHTALHSCHRMTLHLISEEFVLAFRNKSTGNICCTILYTPTHWKLPKLYYINTVIMLHGMCNFMNTRYKWALTSSSVSTEVFPWFIGKDFLPSEIALKSI